MFFNFRSVLLIFKRNLSSITTSITKIHRNIYSRMYPILLVLPNGATIKIRYPVPQGIIKVNFFYYLLYYS